MTFCTSSHVFVGLIIAVSVAGRGVAVAQSPPSNGHDEEEEAAPTPPEGNTEILIDDRQERLEREQREFLEGEQPDQSETVVESQADRERRLAEEAEQEEETLAHDSQVEVRVGAGVPFIAAIKYADGSPCSSNPDEDFCTRVGEPVLDLNVGYGFTEHLELDFLFRLGLREDEASGSRPLQLGVGIRSYPGPDGIFKAFFGGRVLVDITRSDRPNWKSIDIGGRAEFGIQVDPIRFLGLYAQVGVSMFFLRGFLFSPDATGGLQIRFP